MSVRKEFREYVLEQIGRVAPVTGRPMFGGVGLYSDGIMFGLLSEESIYLKVDDQNRGDFVAMGQRIFAPYGEGTRSMQYYELPADLLETPDELRAWIDKARDVSRRAAAAKKKR